MRYAITYSFNNEPHGLEKREVNEPNVKCILSTQPKHPLSPKYQCEPNSLIFSLRLTVVVNPKPKRLFLQRSNYNVQFYNHKRYNLMIYGETEIISCITPLSDSMIHQTSSAKKVRSCFAVILSLADTLDFAKSIN